MARILVVEQIAEPGLELLRAAHDTEVRTGLSRDELTQLVAEGGWDALVTRSQTWVDAELLGAAGPRLSVIGVGSVGTDRIDVAAATRAGVMVINSPTGNTIAAAEHTMALLLALARRIPAAEASLRAGEWQRGRYVGTELRGKTLGIVGLGKIGKALARRALGFEMRIIAFDPYLAAEQAAEFGARLVSFDELLAQADVVSVHTPGGDATRSLIGREELARTKRGAFILNAARGGIVDEHALAAALVDGQIGGAALDVYSREPPAPDNPLRSAPNTILTPHLGASTAEAQERVAVEMAEQVLMALSGVTPPYAVNAPAVAADVAPRLRPYVELAGRLGALARQLVEPPVERLALTYAGEIGESDCTPLRSAALAAFLEGTTDERVNAVNADLVARERGLSVRETKSDASEPWASLVTFEAGGVRLSGSTAHGRPHLAEVGGFAIDAELAGTILVTRHHDRPGIVGGIGTLLAEAAINISSLELSRLSARGEAMMFVTLDEPVPAAVLARARSVDGILEARVVELPPLG
ncbi:MAG: phosphoglycerate dehydrogenase [Candidatus Limnocylindria bacterium]